LSYLANTQTDRQTNKVWQKHYLLGGGNSIYLESVTSNAYATTGLLHGFVTIDACQYWLALHMVRLHLHLAH